MSTKNIAKSATLRNFVIFITAFMCAGSVLGSDVLVETDTKIGRGILRAVGSECLVYSPQHVVEASDGIVYVSSPQIRDSEASILTYFPIDLALLRLPESAQSMCSRSSWRDNGDRVSAILEVQKEGSLSLRKKSGALTELPIRMIETDFHTFFYIEPKQSSQQIVQGMSGSIINVGTYPVGMLLSVKDGVGKALRIDAIANISKTVTDKYASEIDKLKELTTDISAFSHSKKGTPPEDKVSETPSNGVFSGTIANHQVKEHRFITRNATAFKLHHNRQGESARIDLSVLNPAGEKLMQRRRFQTKQDEVFGFGTVDAGEHIIRLKGTNGVGSYHMRLEEVASPEQLQGEENVLSDGTTVTGYIAQNTVAEYRFITRGATAYKLHHSHQSESARIDLSVLNPAGERLMHRRRFETKQDEVFGFGTIDAGEHVVRLEGTSGVGTYYLRLEEVASPEQLQGEENVLSDGTIVTGYIAQNTVAEYRFIARGSTSFKLHHARQSDSVRIDLSVFNPAGERLMHRRRFETKHDEVFGFGTVDAGEHIIRLNGTSGVGSYRFTLEIIR